MAKDRIHARAISSLGVYWQRGINGELNHPFIGTDLMGTARTKSQKTKTNNGKLVKILGNVMKGLNMTDL